LIHGPNFPHAESIGANANNVDRGVSSHAGRAVNVGHRPVAVNTSDIATPYNANPASEIASSRGNNLGVAAGNRNA
jgi:hypothetical protein